MCTSSLRGRSACAGGSALLESEAALDKLPRRCAAMAGGPALSRSGVGMAVDARAPCYRRHQEEAAEARNLRGSAAAILQVGVAAPVLSSPD